MDLAIFGHDEAMRARVLIRSFGRVGLWGLFFSGVSGSLGCGQTTIVAGDGSYNDAATAVDASSVGHDAAATERDVGPTFDAGRASCSSNSDCIVAPRSCCGSCGAATSTDLIALARGDADAYRNAACAGGVGCPECASLPDPYLLATCEAGTCVAHDLHGDPLTECASDADCTLRTAECCGCGPQTADSVVAINDARGNYGDLVCETDAACPPCVPFFDGLAAVCRDGRCGVAQQR